MGRDGARGAGGRLGRSRGRVGKGVEKTVSFKSPIFHAWKKIGVATKNYVFRPVPARQVGSACAAEVILGWIWDGRKRVGGAGSEAWSWKVLLARE